MLEEWLKFTAEIESPEILIWFADVELRKGDLWTTIRLLEHREFIKASPTQLFQLNALYCIALKQAEHLVTTKQDPGTVGYTEAGFVKSSTDIHKLQQLQSETKARVEKLFRQLPSTSDSDRDLFRLAND